MFSAPVYVFVPTPLGCMIWTATWRNGVAIGLTRDYYAKSPAESARSSDRLRPRAAGQCVDLRPGGPLVPEPRL